MGATLLGCLQEYIIIRRIRLDAVEKRNPELAEQYYRELCDLCWTEFRLWQAGLLGYHVFYAWMDSRARSYKDDKGITVLENDKETAVNQKIVWKRLKDGQYYGPYDDFMAFMETVHDGNITEALRTYKTPHRH
jgi:ketosteroid isomerase-like protein